MTEQLEEKFVEKQNNIEQCENEVVHDFQRKINKRRRRKKIVFKNPYSPWPTISLGIVALLSVILYLKKADVIILIGVGVLSLIIFIYSLFNRKSKITR